ncbi:MAG: hypothetical protein Fur0037_03120 [Planctomycetota bacterium]
MMMAVAWPMRLGPWTWTAVNALVWTHPLTSLAAPFLLIDARRRRGRIARLLTAGNCALHAFAGVVQGDANSDLLSALIALPRFVSYTVCRFTLGPGPVRALGDHPWVMHLCAGLLGMLVLAACLRDRRRIGSTMRLCAVACAFALAALVARGVAYTLDQDQFRYCYVPGILLTVVVVGSAVDLSRARARGAIALILALWYPAMNLGGYEWYLPRDPGNGEVVRGFMREIERHERSTGTWRGLVAEARKKNDWPIEIDTR